MKKKILSITLLAILFVIICAVTNVVNAAEYLDAAEPIYDTENAGNPMFFANGTPIVITKGSSETTTLITWAEGSREVPFATTVFGGGHEHEGVYKSASITMNSGTIRNIVGGGLHKSHVENASIILNDGTITGGINGGGAASFSNSTCHSTWYKYEQGQAGATTVVDNAYVEINGGTVGVVFAAGEGISSTLKATLKVTGGTLGYAVAGGSHGFTTETNMIITGGTIGVAQTVNRGSIETATVEVTGGTITKLYVGGDSLDGNVDGTISNVTMSIKEEAVVTTLNMGTSGGKAIETDLNAETVVEYDAGTVATVITANPSAKDVIKQYVVITIGTKTFRIESGKTLEDIDLTDVKSVEGKEFIKFVKAGTEETFDETTVIEENIELTAVFEDVQPISEDNETQSVDDGKQGENDGKDETPKTSVESYIGIAAVIAVIALVGIAIVKKVRK